MLDGVNDSRVARARAGRARARRAVQVQPDPVQSVSRAPSSATSPRERIVAFQKRPAGRRPRHDDPQDARRRHRRRVRPARGPGAGPHEAPARDAHRARAAALTDSDADDRHAPLCRLVARRSLAALALARLRVDVVASSRRRRRSPHAADAAAARRKRPRRTARSCTPRSPPASTSAARWTSRCRSSPRR